jgi:hypothetical protein
MCRCVVILMVKACVTGVTTCKSNMAPKNISLAPSAGQQPKSYLDFLIIEVSRSHTNINTHTPGRTSEQVVSSLQRLLTMQHTVSTRYNHPCPQQDLTCNHSNQAIRPLLWTTQPFGSVNPPIFSCAFQFVSSNRWTVDS